MNKLVFQRDIFHENDDEHVKAISKYFDVVELEDQYTTAAWHNHDAGRYSIAVAKMFGKFEKFTNALSWAGKLRGEMVSPSFRFQTLDYVISDWEADLDDDFYEAAVVNSRRFIRPVSGDKVFAGNVFSIKSFQEEIDFLAQRNVDPHTLCMVADACAIRKEYRLIFIDCKYVSGSQYMDCGELSVSPDIPEHIIEYGKKIYAKYDLPPWVVLDVGVVYGNPSVIEINQIETSSFYAADLDKIYKTWAAYYTYTA